MGTQEDDWTKFNGSGNQYSDDLFPATSQMVAFSAAGQTSDVKMWKRPSEMAGVSGTPDLWGAKGVLPHGIGQGQLGDCWFLAAISALAEKP